MTTKVKENVVAQTKSAKLVPRSLDEQQAKTKKKKLPRVLPLEFCDFFLLTDKLSKKVLCTQSSRIQKSDERTRNCSHLYSCRTTCITALVCKKRCNFFQCKNFLETIVNSKMSFFLFILPPKSSWSVKRSATSTLKHRGELYTSERDRLRRAPPCVPAFYQSDLHQSLRYLSLEAP